jgi:peptidoglycan/xylan/chitin deacetylase (PgdA/CDA1 family)
MKQLFWWLTFRLGVPRLFHRLNTDKIAVLMYHGVVPDDAAVAEGDWMQVRASEFRRHMHYLHRNYDLGSLDQRPGEHGRSGRPRAIVTFDDGYANNHAVAFPILREFGIPATIFLVTGTVDTDRMYWWDRLFLSSHGGIAGDDPVFGSLKRLHPSEIDAEVTGILDSRDIAELPESPPLYRSLSSAEIAELAGSGLIEFGSHTHGHEILAQLSDAEVETTIRTSLNRLATHGVRPRFFAAPNGTYLDRHIPLLRSLGFTAALGTQERLWAGEDNRFRIPRFAIGRGCCLAEFACMISGFTGWTRQRKRLLTAPLVVTAALILSAIGIGMVIGTFM